MKFCLCPVVRRVKGVVAIFDGKYGKFWFRCTSPVFRMPLNAATVSSWNEIWSNLCGRLLCFGKERNYYFSTHGLDSLTTGATDVSSSSIFFGPFRTFTKLSMLGAGFWDFLLLFLKIDPKRRGFKNPHNFFQSELIETIFFE